ncbi:hypothetical protein [Bdellovibrio sp. HCB337]|uniref:hypothetical protein n=1 Tax=Bdellovibrio sp. HCB337 TaxID=3394358 RepID=UPI0039A7002F
MRHVLIVFILLITSWSRAETIVVSVQEDLEKTPPIVELKNYFADALAKEDIHVNFMPLSLERGNFLANKGEIDGELIRTDYVLKNSPNLMITSFPMIYTNFRVVRRKQIKNFKEKNLDTYVGVVFFNSPAVRATIERKKIKVENVATLDQVFLLLASERADYTILPDTIIAAARDRQPLAFQNLVVSKNSFDRSELYFCLNKKNAHLMPKIEKALKRASRGPIWKYRYLPNLLNTEIP